MMELYLLEQLIAFSRPGTLSGAAEKLHSSQPALDVYKRQEPDTDETVAQTADEIIEAPSDFILKELSKRCV